VSRLLQRGGQLDGRLGEHHAGPVQVVGARSDQRSQLFGGEAGIGQRVHHADALDVGAPEAALRRRGDDAQLDQAPKLLGRHPGAVGQVLAGQIVHDPHPPGRPSRHRLASLAAW
jgi:hypothetical protein